MKIPASLVSCALLCVALLVGGCAHPGPMRLTKFHTEKRLTPEDIVLVRLGGLAGEHTDLFLNKVPFLTGEIWTEAFKGDGTAEWVFTIEKGEITQAVAGAGFTNRWSYVAHGKLSGGGRSFDIRAEGSRAAAMNGMGALRQAVELAVADAAKQCRAIITQTK